MPDGVDGRKGEGQKNGSPGLGAADVHAELNLTRPGGFSHGRGRERVQFHWRRLYLIMSGREVDSGRSRSGGPQDDHLPLAQLKFIQPFVLFVDYFLKFVGSDCNNALWR